VKEKGKQLLSAATCHLASNAAQKTLETGKERRQKKNFGGAKTGDPSASEKGEERLTTKKSERSSRSRGKKAEKPPGGK